MASTSHVYHNAFCRSIGFRSRSSIRTLLLWTPCPGLGDSRDSFSEKTPFVTTPFLPSDTK